MAIGIPFPPRQVPSSRLLWRDAGTVFARHTLQLKAEVLRVVTTSRILWKRLTSAAKDLSPLRARARQRQRAQFNAFEKQYENLVDLLCAAAHEGIHQERDLAYGRVRSWMVTHYPCIAKHVRNHWQNADESGRDPFHSLYACMSLEDAINGADGIEDIMRSRTALEAYRSELDASLT